MAAQDGNVSTPPAPCPEDLTREKSLFQVVKHAWRIRSNRFQRWSTLVVLLSTSLYSLLNGTEVSQFADQLRSMTSVGFNLTLTVFGFLLAGFTFFATLADKSLFLHMAKTPHVTYGMSYLKYYMIVFVRVLFFYWAFIMLCFVILVFGAPDGLISSALRPLREPYEHWVRSSLIFIGVPVVVTLGYYLLALLSSFIYNIYHVVMLSIRWHWESEDQRKKEEEQKAQQTTASDESTEPQG